MQISSGVFLLFLSQWKPFCISNALMTMVGIFSRCLVLTGLIIVCSSLTETPDKRRKFTLEDAKVYKSLVDQFKKAGNKEKDENCAHIFTGKWTQLYALTSIKEDKSAEDFLKQLSGTETSDETLTGDKSVGKYIAQNLCDYRKNLVCVQSDSGKGYCKLCNTEEIPVPKDEFDKAAVNAQETCKIVPQLSGGNVSGRLTGEVQMKVFLIPLGILVSRM